MQNNNDLFSLMARIFSDPIPDDLRFVYLFGQTEDNQISVLERGIELQKKGYSVMISRNKEGNGYPGYTAWSEYFKRRGATAPLPVLQESYQPANTLTEAENLVLHAAETGVEKIAIVASPFHQLRAFFTIVGRIIKKGEYIFIEQNLEIRVYSIPGVPLPWGKEVIHSQGITRGKRSDLLVSEWEKMKEYIRRGDLPTSTQVFEYLEWRDDAIKVRL